MSKFVSVVVAFVLLFGVAVAEDSVYTRTAVVVGLGIAYSDALEVEVIDEDGECWSYYQDIEDTVRIGDVVILSIWDNGIVEDNEIVDVELIGNFSIEEVLTWLER